MYTPQPFLIFRLDTLRNIKTFFSFSSRQLYLHFLAYEKQQPSSRYSNSSFGSRLVTDYIMQFLFCCPPPLCTLCTIITVVSISFLVEAFCTVLLIIMMMVKSVRCNFEIQIWTWRVYSAAQVYLT